MRRPNGVEMAPQLDLREHFDLYAGIRPIFLFHARRFAAERRAAPGEIDFVIVRESTEGLFSARKGSSSLGRSRSARCDANLAAHLRAPVSRRLSAGGDAAEDT